MFEIIPYIILILVLLVLELIQIAWAKSKIKNGYYQYYRLVFLYI